MINYKKTNLFIILHLFCHCLHAVKRIPIPNMNPSNVTCSEDIPITPPKKLRYRPLD